MLCFFCCVSKRKALTATRTATTIVAPATPATPDEWASSSESEGESDSEGDDLSDSNREEEEDEEEQEDSDEEEEEEEEGIAQSPDDRCCIVSFFPPFFSHVSRSFFFRLGLSSNSQSFFLLQPFWLPSSFAHCFSTLVPLFFRLCSDIENVRSSAPTSNRSLSNSARKKLKIAPDTGKSSCLCCLLLISHLFIFLSFLAPCFFCFDFCRR